MDITGCSLAELVDDPLIGLVMKSDGMKSDGVDRCELNLLLERVAGERLPATQFASHCRPRPPTTKAAPCSHC
jgi:hypothetical protein